MRGCRAYGLVFDAGRLRHDVGVVGGAVEGPSSGPEAGAADFVGVRGTTDCAFACGCGPAGKARAGQVEAPPEEVNRTAFAHEVAAESFQHFGTGDEDAPEAM